MENLIAIKFYPQEEILGMSGPWVGKVEVDQQLLNGVFLDQPFIIDNSRKYLLLVRYLKARMLKDVKFQILLIDIATMESYIYFKDFDKLYIESFTDDCIVYYNSFNNRNGLKKNEIKFKITDFVKELH
jgi:hypothetical protein